MGMRVMFPSSVLRVQVALITRYWSWLFAVIVFLSYFLVYPFILLFPKVEKWFSVYDPSQYGVGVECFSSPTFW